MISSLRWFLVPPVEGGASSRGNTSIEVSCWEGKGSMMARWGWVGDWGTASVSAVMIAGGIEGSERFLPLLRPLRPHGDNLLGRSGRGHPNLGGRGSDDVDLALWFWFRVGYLFFLLWFSSFKIHHLPLGKPFTNILKILYLTLTLKLYERL